MFDFLFLHNHPYEEQFKLCRSSCLIIRESCIKALSQSTFTSKIYHKHLLSEIKTAPQENDEDPVNIDLIVTLNYIHSLLSQLGASLDGPVNFLFFKIKPF